MSRPLYTRLPGGSALPRAIAGALPEVPPSSTAGSVQRVGLPPDEFMPAEAQPFRGFGEASVTGAAAGVSWAVPAGLQFQLPPNDVGVIRFFGVTARQWFATSDVVWQLRINKAAAPGWGTTRIPTSNSAFISDSWGPQDLKVLLPKGAFIDVLATAFDVTTYVLGAQFVGWHMDAALWQSYQLGR